jgi:hypothetical protein
MSEVAPHEHQIDTGKSVLSFDELGMVQPGMARIMPEIGARIWKCYYAGKAENRALARFQLKEAVNLMEMGVLLRPKYTDNMYKFIEEEVAVVKQIIEDEVWDKFDEAFNAMVDAANAYHGVYDKPYLKWQIPEMPPPDLDMRGGMTN